MHVVSRTVLALTLPMASHLGVVQMLRRHILVFVVLALMRWRHLLPAIEDSRVCIQDAKTWEHFDKSAKISGEGWEKKPRVSRLRPLRKSSCGHLPRPVGAWLFRGRSDRKGWWLRTR